MKAKLSQTNKGRVSPMKGRKLTEQQILNRTIKSLNKRIKNYCLLTNEEDLNSFKTMIMSLTDSAIKIQNTYGIRQDTIYRWRC